MDLKELLGEELYNQVMEKAGDDNKIAVVSDGNWLPKSKFDEVNNEAKDLKKQISDRDKQLEDLQKQAGGNEELKAQIDSLKQANQEQKEELENKMKKQRFGYELDSALKSAGARNPIAVKPFLQEKIDNGDIKLNDEGKLFGLSEQLESLKENEPYLFAIDSNSNSEGGSIGNTNSYIPGNTQRTNSPKDKDPRELGRLRAMERYGLNTEKGADQ